MDNQESQTSTQLRSLISRWQQGDELARADLITYAYERYRGLAKSMLDGDPLRRWVETDELLNRVLYRLHQALDKVELTSGHHLFALVAQHINWEMIDLGRKNRSKERGLAAHYSTNPDRDRVVPLKCEIPDKRVPDPLQVQIQIEVRERLAALPEEDQAVILLYIDHGMSFVEIARLWGVVPKTMRDRFQAACIKIKAAFNDEDPRL